MQRDFAFVQTAPGRVFVGWGPFEQLPFRRAERPAFYVTDFFLDDVHPWRHPATWEEITIEEFASRFGELENPEIEWEAPARDDFTRLFDSAQEAMARGEFHKIVPVLFESGRFVKRGQWWRHFVSQIVSLPPGLRAYGYSYNKHGMIGATPEVLFEAEAHGYRTMALAGTRPVGRADELLHDPKERLEHRLVVDDIVRRLAPFGNVEIGPLGVLRLPQIAHLITPI
ncbi:MAG TPA: chorismate-binding protein, partial [Thermoanaerobaculia bacterium]|nr:chorismate-binding protein [Thermoanaerobaculia bacterium]